MYKYNVGALYQDSEYINNTDFIYSYSFVMFYVLSKITSTDGDDNSVQIHICRLYQEESINSLNRVLGLDSGHRGQLGACRSGRNGRCCR